MRIRSPFQSPRRHSGSTLLATFISLLFVSTSATAQDHGEYEEQLVLKPLAGQSLLASFNFKSYGSATSFDRQMFQFFPRSLGQILQHSKTRELHLKFALGRWDAEQWGTQPANGQHAGGTGVELWAWVEAEDDAEADALWTSLNNALSGLFCASLNFIDSTRTIRPILSFQPSGSHSNNTLPRLHLLHGTLPHETVCTENLTPFLKLLPCKGKAGISTLLDGHKLFDAAFQSMSIDVRPVCNSAGACSLEMTQTVDMVIDIVRALRTKDSPVPRPRDAHELVCDGSKEYASHEACFPIDHSSDLAFSLSELFGRPLRGACPLSAGKFPVCVDTPSSRQMQGTTGQQDVGDAMRCFTLTPEQDFDITFPSQNPSIEIQHEEPPIYAERSFTGHGQERGGVQAVLTNPSLTSSVELIYLESLPWFMKPYLHTFKAEIVGGDPPGDRVIQEVYYRPALDRKRGTQLEARMVVPMNSTVLVTYDFDKAVLRYTEYPPDANRGFDVASAVITVPSLNGYSTAIRTTSLLLSLPTPDFSMPYNVIIFTSTVMALAFGSIFNLLTRRFVLVDEVERFNIKVLRDKSKGRVIVLKGRLTTLFKSKQSVKKDQ